jgi:hypothetical protein
MKNMTTSSVPRRQFLQQTATVAGAVAFPQIVPSSVLGKDGATAPSDRTKKDAIDRKKPASLRGEHLQNLYDYLHDPTYRLKWDKQRGYSAEFAQRHDEIIRGIIENPERRLTIVAGFDDICNYAACPKKKPSVCQSETALEKDRSLARQYGLELGRQYKCKQVVELLLKAKKRAKWPL